MLTIRKVCRTDELKCFKELEDKYNCLDFKERLQANPKEVFRMVTQRTGRKINGKN